MPTGEPVGQSGQVVGQAGERRALERPGKGATGAGVVKGQSGLLATKGAATTEGVTRCLNFTTPCAPAYAGASRRGGVTGSLRGVTR